jgi:hypothetical protein
MKIKFKKIFFLLLFWPLSSFAQWCLVDTASTILGGLADVDTMTFDFPIGPVPRYVTKDQTKFGNTALQRANFMRVVEKVDVWFDRQNIVGNADSFRVYYKILHPSLNQVASNDSTFVLGTANTFVNLVNFSRFQITLPACKGVRFYLVKGDLATGIRTKIIQSFVYSQ